MKIIDTQTATLTNIEVLSYFTANPPRKSPEAPPNVKNFIPKPDLRDHCTVVTEIHNYVERISPHLLRYPRYTHDSSADLTRHTLQQPSTDQQEPYIELPEPTPLDNALRKVVQELAPYNLTKSEVIMIINLGVGIKPQKKSAGVDAMDVSGEEAMQNGQAGSDQEVEEQQQEEEEGAAEYDDEYRDSVLSDLVIEEVEERFSEEDIENIFKIMTDNLGPGL